MRKTVSSGRNTGERDWKKKKERRDWGQAH